MRLNETILYRRCERETSDRKSWLHRFAGYAPLTRGLNGAVRPSFRGVKRRSSRLLLTPFPVQNRCAESGEEEEEEDRVRPLVDF